MAERTLLRRASIAPGREVDLVLQDGRVVPAAAGADLGSPGSSWDLDGRPVLPGLTDHHIHLFAAAASLESVDCSPDALSAGGGIAAVLRAARQQRPEGWLRGVGYDLTSSGPLDRHGLDRVRAGPIRVQDRTGIHWILDSRGLDAVLPPDRSDWPPGVEVDAADQPTGHLVRLDAWLRRRLPATPPDVREVGSRLASFGVTAVVDASGSNI